MIFKKSKKIIFIGTIFLAAIFAYPKILSAILPGCPPACGTATGKGENPPPEEEETSSPESQGTLPPTATSTQDGSSTPPSQQGTAGPSGGGSQSTSTSSSDTVPGSANQGDSLSQGTVLWGESRTPIGLISFNTILSGDKTLLHPEISGSLFQSQCEKILEGFAFDNDLDADGLVDFYTDGKLFSQEESYGTDPKDPDTDNDSYFDGEEVCSGFDPLKVPVVSPIDSVLQKRLLGYILLQTERHGEAWYMYPHDGLRYYLRGGSIAYQIMRFLSLGITNADLEKIPAGVDERSFFTRIEGGGALPSWLDRDSDNDGLPDKMEEGLKTSLDDLDSDKDGVSDGDEVLKNHTNPLGPGKLTYDKKLIERLKGKILLQVESRGEAWYVNPKDGKRYYLKDGNAAYQIMRFLSLGITNENINKLPMGTMRGKIR